MKTYAKSFKDLLVWQKAHRFVLEIYKLTENFPKAEMFGLTSQLRRSAISVPANISEGFKKKSKADKVRYYNIAQGSLEESHYYLILSSDLGYAETENLLNIVDEVGKMLGSYIKAIINS
jgi:four helix bundle protein